MKKLLLLLFAITFSSASFSGWIELNENAEGSLTFIDLDRIRKEGNFVYFVMMQDYSNINPLPKGMNFMSAIIHIKGDCRAFRYKFLNTATYKHPMAEGLIESTPFKNADWRFLIPDSVYDEAQEIACYKK
jgi:hypothetical protein